MTTKEKCLELINTIEQDIKEVVSNIKHELDKADLPYLGLDLAPNINESLATIDLIKKEK